MNWYGLYILFSKEVWRFSKLATQTILAPVVVILLYLLVFSSVLGKHVRVYDDISYTAFLVPGLIMMTVIQNAFTNSSTSFFQSKLMGNIVFMLIAPLSSVEFYLAYMNASIVRGIIVGIGVWLASLLFVVVPVYNFWILIAFALLNSAVLGTMGLISALWAEKWDHISAFQNFVILPLSFLSGVFYSVHALPEFWQKASHYNPFFYMIDGFRYGFFGKSDVDISFSFLVVSLFFILISTICLWLLHIGYKTRY